MQPERFALKSGLTVLFEPAEQESSAIDIAVGFGSALEPRGKAGIAHFIEHMFFTGTPERSRKSVFQAIEEVGGEMNAFTSRQGTHYYSRILGRHFSRSLDVMLGCYNSCLFEEKELELERRIILNEIRDAIDRPSRFVVDEFLRDCLPAEMGRRVIGTKESVSSISREDLLGQFRTAYNPNNTVVGITAKGNASEAVEKISTLGEGRKGRRVEKKIREAKPKLKRREIERKTEQAHICIGFPVMNARSRDYPAFEIIDALLGGGISSRLVQEIREKRGLSYAVQTLFQAEMDYGFFLVYAAAKPRRVREIEEIALREFERIGQGVLTEKELERGKNYVEGREILARENSEDRARWLTQAELFGWQDFDEWMKRIRQVSAEQVRETAEKYLNTSEYVLTSLRPKK